ncbi:sugar ABC transporter permease [Halalkalibacterium halodurans]|uniref:Sugar transport system (Permease) n=1 Tax=Halalkalibacterium halodurans (strain ATCC BAA-125 / DSM 18197 / FERM 7344 / JCM 9153 / C-125) TaxID=272558 RepID=Q9KBK1_HALH5|nr:sugar ABC transporter permease [Halalkalibacterium halodurans]MDY7222486.1 sugar ABC transporter permease [Halalkalibacterium halodurans]MDY7241707.1 sugar ABC transporter permease [Halalkalibacterium halodurans]MED4082686.1 sugar ABC transporter permease [Halalkalibacterium halodurans]MED4085886.1 sugar ABC transporter permease [Halalkalibacterium halodurans]MED4106854.1 sugar ABC transporter permease [Halalkalibacterium halodurans]
MAHSAKERWLTEERRTALSAYAFISPFFILFAVFGLFPMIFSFYLSFFRWDGLNPMSYVGLANFQLIFNDPTFFSAIKNTFIIGILGTLPQIIVGILLAFALNSALIRFQHTFRTLVFLPYITSIVAVAIIFGLVFNNQPFGLANYVLSLFNIDPVRWSQEYWPVKIAIATMVFWRWVGYNTIIFLAGMQSIPKELYEAAKIDGATIGQQIRLITVPMLKPFILFVVFTATIGSLQLFTEPLIFLGRGLREEGITMVAYLWRDAFVLNAFGTASAAAIVLFFIIITLTAINLLITNRIGRSKKVM